MTSLSPTALFVRRFGAIAVSHDPHARFSDFLELATCAFRKTTLPPGAAAEAIEARYMAVVGRRLSMSEIESRTADTRVLPCR